MLTLKYHIKNVLCKLLQKYKKKKIPMEVRWIHLIVAYKLSSPSPEDLSLLLRPNPSNGHSVVVVDVVADDDVVVVAHSCFKFNSCWLGSSTLSRG